MRVPDTLRSNVVFLGRLRTDDRMEKRDLLGTAFFVTMPSDVEEGDLKHFWYIVTAKHVVEGLQGAKCGVRINNMDGKTASILIAPEKWWFHPTDPTVDVAVLPFGPPRDVPFDYSLFPIESFATEENIKKASIGVGDDVFITGLFAHNIGDLRNQPIVRTGNVALMASDPIPVHDYKMAAHLIEARSIGGLSGSPAFVRQTVSAAFSPTFNEFKPGQVVRELKPDEWPKDAIFVTGLGPFFLLGLMHGHWDIAASQKNEVLFSADRSGAVNMGIALVVPATKILETINHPELKQLRRQMHEVDKKGLPPITLDSVQLGQTTKKGKKIPIPSRSQVFKDLEKVTRRRKPSS